MLRQYNQSVIEGAGTRNKNKVSALLNVKWILHT